MRNGIKVIILSLFIAACGKDADVASSEAAYVQAQAMVREQMKSPSSARFASFPEQAEVTKSEKLYSYSGDTVHVNIMDSTAIVVGAYEAQNGFGVYLPGKFRVMLKRNGDEWTGLTGDPSTDVSLLKD